MSSNQYFDKDEITFILQRAQQLYQRGYFTGINFLQSDKPIPKEGIILHFLHDSKKHIRHIQQFITTTSLIIPRNAFYSLDAAYFDKPYFDEEYASALFYDNNFTSLSLENAKKKREGISVSHTELDLLIPLDPLTLEAVVTQIRLSDEAGPQPWLDPVIIIKTQSILPTLQGFSNQQSFVNIRRENEEFYTIVSDPERAAALHTYIKKVCSRRVMGSLDENSVAFDMSQVNDEFLSYLKKFMRPLEPFH